MMSSSEPEPSESSLNLVLTGDRLDPAPAARRFLLDRSVDEAEVGKGDALWTRRAMWVPVPAVAAAAAAADDDDDDGLGDVRALRAEAARCCLEVDEVPFETRRWEAEPCFLGPDAGDAPRGGSTTTTACRTERTTGWTLFLDFWLKMLIF